jgi:hypothetical protein
MAREIEKMGSEDIEQLLENAKFKHLSEATLISYNDNQLDKTGLALADAHLKLCLICERRLAFLKEEAEALDSYVRTEEDRASIEQLIREPKTRDTSYVQTEIQRLASHIKDLRDAWIMLFSKPAMRGTGDGDEVWRYESADGLLTAWAVLDNKANLTVHLSSPEPVWEGARIRFRLGPFSKEVTLQRTGDNEITARIDIPRQQRAKKMKDMSVEVL